MEVKGKLISKYKLKKEIDGEIFEDEFKQTFYIGPVDFSDFLIKESTIISDMERVETYKEIYTTDKEYIIVYTYFKICEEIEGLPHLIDILNRSNQLISDFIDNVSQTYIDSVLAKVYDLPIDEDGAEVKIELDHKKDKYQTKMLDQVFLNKVENDLKEEIKVYLQNNARILKPQNRVTEADIKNIISKHYLTHIDFNDNIFTSHTNKW